MAGEDLRVLRDIRRAFVGQHLDDRWRTIITKAAFHGLKHDAANFGAADPSVDHGAASGDFAVMGIDDEGTTDDITVSAGELEG